jgi:hypothetical protein
MRGNIIIISISADTERAGQDSIHGRVRGQDGAQGLQASPQLGLEVAGDGDHHGCRSLLPDLLDQRQLTIRSERGLHHHHVLGVPTMAPRLHGIEWLDRDAQPPCGGANALAEHQIVLDQEQAPGHGSNDSR